jgi:glycerol uptake facilitator-like aquaporin
MNKILLKKLLAEFVGTCFLVMIVVGSGIMAQSLSTDQLSILLANTIATGAGLTALIWIFISISGAHFNPAVSLIMFLKKELTLKEFSCFS